MSLLRSGLSPVLRRVALPAMAVFAGALLSGGCSSRRDGTTSFIWSNDHPRYNVAAAPPRPLEMEDDGREAQVPPPSRIRGEPDDPREPYSPNYGTVPAASQRQAGAAPAGAGTRVPLPDDLPPSFRRKLVSALAEE